MLPGMTVLQALSSAGGFTTFADVKKIHVVRMRNGKQIEIPFNYRTSSRATMQSRTSSWKRATRLSSRKG